jgi:hypothetical protein
MTKPRDLATLGGGFTQSGTGAIRRTVEDKLKDTVSVKDFGAVGDNTTNDTTAISSARTAFPNTSIDLAGASYRVTTIPAGWGIRNGLLTLDPADTDDQPANEAYGYGALASNTYVPKQHVSSTLTFASGNFNVAFGSYALGSNTTGRRQTAVGSQALRLSTSGFYNTAVGAFALYDNVTGSDNTAVGVQALQFSTGSSNVAVGSGALTSLTTANFNSALGKSALSANVTFANCSGVGYNAQVTGADQVQLGDAFTTTYAYGAVQNRSDVRDKADIQDTILGLEFINSLRPVDFKWDYREDYKGERDGSKKRTRFHHGLIAQEVKQVCDGLGVNFGGYQDHSINGGKDVLSLGYDELIAPLIKAVQQLSAEVEDLKSQLNA